jgi:hypothetical protein
MVHQKNKEALQDKHLKDKDRATKKREEDRDQLRNKQRLMQTNSYDPTLDESKKSSNANVSVNPKLGGSCKKCGGIMIDDRCQSCEATQKTDIGESKKKGLWANIHAKRKRGEKPAKKGDKDYPETLNVEGYGVGDVDQKVGAVTPIPKKDQDDARLRILAKAAAKRKARLTKEETITERGDFWHPDPDKDRKLGGPGANSRAREDRAAASKPKEDPKKLRKGESYMDWGKRQKANK